MLRYFKYIVAVGVVVWGAGLIVAAQGAGQDQKVTIKREAARSISSVDGKDSYAEYCAVCHGPGAAGNGPATPALKIAPSDLTKLAARNGGKFDAVMVEQMILGKSKVPLSHGTPDMPIWGPVFRAIAPDTGAEALRIHNLVNYLKSVQAK